MKWTTNIRASGLKEWVCSHGIGHPDHESAKKMALHHKEWEDGKFSKEEVIKAWHVHGCDGCCARRDFPGAKGRPKQ